MSANRLESIETDHGAQVVAETMHGTVDDQGIDEWELAASRRALMNLRTLLYVEPMMELLKEQREEAERLHRKYLAESDGEWAGTRVIIHASGVSSKELLQGLAATLAGTTGSDEERRQMALNFGFPLHPEHYATPPEGVVETMGGIPTQTRVEPDDDPPEWVVEHMDESYPVRRAGKGMLLDGTPHTHVLQQFKDTDDGLQACLDVWYPAACPPNYVAEHAQHYAVETRNLIRVAAARRDA